MVGSRTRIVVLVVGLIWGIAALAGMGATRDVVHAQVAPAQVCYVVADWGDALWRVDLSPLATTRVGVLDPGGTNFTRVEAIAFNLDGTILYGAHDDHSNGIWGTINTSTGLFTQIGPIGPGNGLDPGTGLPTTDPLNDVDALAIHPLTGDIWGITQDPGQNKIFRINPTTGSVVPDTFGSGLDFAQLVLPIAQPDIDDLAIDPDTGEFFAIANASGANDRLFEININGFNPPSSPGFNPALGTMTATEVTPLTFGGNPVNDMEGFAVFNDGTFYGTTGDEAGTNSDRFWVIDTTTGVVLPLTAGSIDSDGVAPLDEDFESAACLSAGSNIKSGVVFEDLDGSGTLNGPEGGYAGARVEFYRDTGNGTFDGAPTDTLIQTVVTGGSGAYSFEVATEGIFFAVLDQSTLPAGSVLTTVGVYTVNFVQYDNTLSNNNFGFSQEGEPPASPTPTPTPTPTGDRTPTPTVPPGTTPVASPPPELVLYDPALLKTGDPRHVVPGEVVTFTITASNNGPTPFTGVVITDGLDAAFFETVVEAFTSKGSITIVDNLLVTVQIGDMAPGEQVTITVKAKVRLDLVPPASTLNVAFMDGNEFDILSSSAAVDMATLPGTGYPPAEPDAPVSSTMWFRGVWLALALGVLSLLAIQRRKRSSS